MGTIFKLDHAIICIIKNASCHRGHKSKKSWINQSIKTQFFKMKFELMAILKKKGKKCLIYNHATFNTNFRDCYKYNIITQDVKILKKW